MSIDAIIILGVLGLIGTHAFVFVWGSSKGFRIAKSENHPEMFYLKQMIERLKKDNEQLEEQNDELKEIVEDLHDRQNH